MSDNSFEKHLNDLLKPNIYNELIKEITPTLIPAELVQTILVMYNNGTTVELTGDDIHDAVPVSRYQTPEQRKATRDNIKDIKIYVNTEKLADFCDGEVNSLFNKLNLL